MKITAFILSILLSTTAIAENRMAPINADDVKEIMENATNDRFLVVKIDDPEEGVDEALNRGDITEEERNDLLSRIQSEDTYQTASQNIVEGETDGEGRSVRRWASIIAAGMAGSVASVLGVSTVIPLSEIPHLLRWLFGVESLLAALTVSGTMITGVAIVVGVGVLVAIGTDKLIEKYGPSEEQQ